MPKARIYSYLRFSSPQQKRGDSKRRQNQLIKDWAQKLKLDIAEAYMDEGVSAYSGANIAEGGALGVFLAKVRAGEIPKGSVLVVESLDRLSRQSPLDALPIFIALLNAGVSIVTGGDEQHYTRQSINENTFLLFGSIMVMSRAHEESKTKSKRLTAAWTRKRKDAQDKLEPITKIVPAWIRMINERGTKRFELIPERVQIVERIFNEAINGLGRHTIAKQLNEEGVPVFGRGKAWHSSYIIKILQNDAIIGTYHPHRMEMVEGEDPTKLDKKKRRPAGAPVLNFYPRALSDDLWHAAQLAVNNRAMLQLKGRTGRSASSPFGRLAFCGSCGEPLVSWTPGSTGRQKDGRLVRKLICLGHRRGLGCIAPVRHEMSLAVDHILSGLEAFQQTYKAKDPTPQLFGQISEKKAALAEVKSEQRALISMAKKRTRAIAALNDEIDNLQDRIDALTAEIEALNRAVSVINKPQGSDDATIFELARAAFEAEELGQDTPEHRAIRQKTGELLRRQVHRIVIQTAPDLHRQHGYWITPRRLDGEPDHDHTYLIPLTDGFALADDGLFVIAELLVERAEPILKDPLASEGEKYNAREDIADALAYSPALRREPYLSLVKPHVWNASSDADQAIAELEGL